MTASPVHPEIETVYREAGSLLQLHFVRPADGLAFVQRARTGDEKARQLFLATMRCVRKIEAPSSGALARCARCQKRLRRQDYTVVLAVPACDDPTRAVGFGFCLACSARPATARAKTLEVLRQVWPDGRLVDVPDRPVAHA